MTDTAILFDLDGTLIDSLEDIRWAMNQILTADGLKTHERSAYAVFIGQGARRLVQSALPEDRRAETEAYLARFRALYRQHLIVHTAPYPEIPALLEELTERQIPMAVLSNKPDEMTQVLVRHFFGDVPFRAVAGAREGHPKKPDAAAAAPLLTALATAPAQVLMVGDTKTDMLTAQGTGMRGVGVTWGFRDRAELEAHGAAAVIDSPQELLALL